MTTAEETRVGAASTKGATTLPLLEMGDTVVVKLGGATLDGAGAALDEVAALVRAGLRVVVVHGGGPLITAWLEKIGVPSRFVDGVRETDEAALEVAVMVLRGLVNTGVVRGLAAHGVTAQGLSGVDNGLLRATREPALGLVGTVASVDAAQLHHLLDVGVVPVIAPLALDVGGQLLSINADNAAAAIAAALGADAALFLTDTPGVLDGDGAPLAALDRASIETLKADGVIYGGMIPKVMACLAALEGARLAAILDGRSAGALTGLLGGTIAGTLVRASAPLETASAPHDALAEVAAREALVYMHTFKREPVALVRGRGARVWDADGKGYLDFVAGIAVNILGHAHPGLTAAITRQARTLMHTSNLYYTRPQVELAELLTAATGMEAAFFSNSGAEANEGAIKIARKWGKRHKNNAFEIICADNSFHGRTLATVAATGKPRYQEPFAPMPAGFTHVPYNNLSALEAAMSEGTAAVLLEPIQGEGGIHPAAPGYLAAVRRLCDERNVLLMFDEVQTGMGRTGTFLACQGEGVVPDVVTLAKGLGGGVPLGAVLARGSANILEPGDHGSTQGGNVLSCTAGVATMRALHDEGLIAHAATIGAALKASLESLQAHGLPIAEVRGRGLMLALETAPGMNAPGVVASARGRGLLVNATGETTVRLVPPLMLSAADVDEGVSILAAVLGDLAASPRL